MGRSFTVKASKKWAVYLMAIEDIKTKSSSYTSFVEVMSAVKFLTKFKEKSIYGQYIKLSDHELNLMLKNNGIDSNDILGSALKNNEIKAKNVIWQKKGDIFKQLKNNCVKDDVIKRALKLTWSNFEHLNTVYKYF